MLNDYGDLKDRSNHLAIPAFIATVLVPPFVIARCAARYHRTGFWFDDWTIIAALVIALPANALMILASAWGFGKHEEDLIQRPPPGMPFGDGRKLIEKSLELFYADQICYSATMGLIKVSELLLYIRIFSMDNQRSLRWISWGLIVAISACSIAAVIVAIFQCKPVESAWGHVPGHCIDLEAFWYARAYFNVVTDFLVIILPVPFVFGVSLPWSERILVEGLHMSAKKKISVCGLFGLGIFVCISTVLRMAGIGPAAFNEDRTWNAVDLCKWSVIEVGVGIICACLPAMTQSASSLYRRFFPKKRSRSNSRGSSAHLMGRIRTPVEKSVESQGRPESHRSSLQEV